MSKANDEDYRFRIGMLVRHPTLDLTSLLQPIGIAPAGAGVGGSPRSTPTGRTLSGLHRQSYWTWDKVVHGQRNFIGSALDLAKSLAPHTERFEKIAKTGGSTMITLALPSSINTGGSLSADDMRRLAEQHLSLGIEVVPDPDNFRDPA